MLKNKRIFFILLVVFFNNLLFKPLKGETAFDSTNGYAKNEILLMKWGDGDKEAGLKEEERNYEFGGNIRQEMVRTTPSGIKIDGKGNVYFEDVVKGKVVKYDQENRLVNKYESNEGFLKYLADNEQEGLYIFNPIDNSVDIILSGKNKIRKIDRHITEYLLKYDLKIKNKVLFNGKKKITSFNEKDTSDIESREEEAIGEYDLNAKNALIKYKVIEPSFTYYFYNLKKINAACDEIKHKIGFQPDYHGFISIDKDKNIYYLFSRLHEDPYDPTEYFIVKIHPLLCKIEIIFLEIDEFTGYMASPVDFVAVNKDGNIYQLLNKEDGVHVIYWSK